MKKQGSDFLHKFIDAAEHRKYNMKNLPLGKESKKECRVPRFTHPVGAYCRIGRPLGRQYKEKNLKQEGIYLSTLFSCGWILQKLQHTYP